MKKTHLFLFVLTILSINMFGQVGINTENPQGIFNIDGGNNNNLSGTPTANQQKDDFTVLADGSVGIGTTQPDASAILELNVNELASGSKKGFLAPRVELTSHTDTSTISTPAVGLLVYNLGTQTNFTYNGYVFWNGSEWRTLSGLSLAPGSISAINCNRVTLFPSSYNVGIPYTGTLSVSYVGGNGGTYPAQSIGPVNGLTATLSAGNFELGSGTLNYSVNGIPTISSPNTTTFNINIGDQTCAAVVGVGDDVQMGELVYYKANNISASIGGGGANGTTTANWLSTNVDPSTPLPVIGGKLRIDGYFTSGGNLNDGTVSFNPRLVNISSSPVKFWFAALTNVDRFNGANIVLSAAGSNSGAPGGGGWVNLDNGIYSSYGNNGITTSPNTSITNTGTTNQEVLTMDINLDDKWYRVYYFINIDNNDTTSTGDDYRRLYVSIQRLY